MENCSKRTLELLRHSLGVFVREDELQPISKSVVLSGADQLQILPESVGDYFFFGDLTINVIDSSQTGSGLLSFGTNEKFGGYEADLPISSGMSVHYYESLLLDHLDFVNTDLSGSVVMVHFSGYQIPIKK